MSDLLRFKKEAIDKGLCKEYRDKWDRAKSKKDLIDIALDANGIEYMAEMLSGEWGLTPEYICEEFAEYINGAYTRGKDGYKTAMYVKYEGEIIASCTAYLIVSCDVDIKIPENCVCRIFVCADSNVIVDCEGDCEVYYYGRRTQISEILGSGDVRLIGIK